MTRAILLTLILVHPVLAENTKIKVLKVDREYAITGTVTAWGDSQELLLPGVTAFLFSKDKLTDSASLDQSGAFRFSKLKEGEYDLAFRGNSYFPKKICGLRVDDSQKVYPTVYLVNLDEKYPDSTWRPDRYLYVTFKPELNAKKVLRKLEFVYRAEVIPFNNNSSLQPMLRYDGTEFYRAKLEIPKREEGIDWANRLILDPEIYNVEPDVRLPLPPAIKTNQTPRAGGE
ncbi:MAG: carboxypeptidase-like regulatory domain-containing protein [candidate division Zixibacteria bacterium]|nr:carboxypeptidase-like regulatory domain-containing protein [candidate division Zixibacteria bacterium]